MSCKKPCTNKYRFHTHSLCIGGCKCFSITELISKKKCECVKKKCHCPR